MERILIAALAAAIRASGVFFIVFAHAWDQITAERLFKDIGEYNNSDRGGHK